MELQGKVIAILPARSGVSARGEWTAQDFVIETHEAYPKKLVFSVFGQERLDRFAIQMGQEVLVSFDIDAHEYNGRWFNSVRAFDVRQVDPAQYVGGMPGVQAPPTSPVPGPVNPVPGPVNNVSPVPPTSSPVPESPVDDDSELPF